MSLILDALKKSDEARRRGKPAKRGSPYAPQPVQPRRPVHRYYLLVVLALCLNAVLFVWWLRPWESGPVAKVAPEPASTGRMSVAKAPAGKTPAQSTQPAQAMPAAQGEQMSRTTQAPQVKASTSETPATQVEQSSQATSTAQVSQAGSTTEVAQSAQATHAEQPEQAVLTAQAPQVKTATSETPATQVEPTTAPVDAPTDSARAGEAARAPASDDSSGQEGVGRIAPAEGAGSEVEKKPEPETADSGSAAMAKVKEADPPGASSGHVPPSGAGNVRPPMPQAERPLPETAPRDAVPPEPVKTARLKPPGKAVKAPDGERGPAEGVGHPAQVGGSRELVSDLRSLMGAEDTPKKASASGRVLKYYELPSSLRDSMPKLSMSMLLHSKKSEERWVNINGAKVREGQEIASGLKVVEITPDGAVFSYKGQRFYKAVMGD